MSTLSLRKIKHDSSAVDNITTNSDGGVGIGGIDPSALPAFIDHAVKVQNGGGLGIQSTNATDNRWIFFGHGTANLDVQRAGIVNQGSDQSLALTTAGTQRLIVDAAGRVTLPYQPAFLATRNAGDSGSLSANTVLPFNYTIFNRGNHFNTSTYTFTAPVAGVYMFYTHLYHQVPGSTSTRIMIKKNGSEIFQGTDVIPHAFVANYEGVTRDMTSQTSYVIDMNVGDYVNVAVRNGQTGRFYGGHSLFYGYLLG